MRVFIWAWINRRFQAQLLADRKVRDMPMIWTLTPKSEAVRNSDGTFTTVEIMPSKYPGGTNQVKAEKITIRDREYWVYIGSAKEE